MTRFALAVLTAALLTLPAFATAPVTESPDDFSIDPPLPRYQTLEELATPIVPELDDITPPPANPVTLEGEFETKEGILMRWPYYFEDMFASLVDEIQDVATVFIIVANSSWEQNCISTLGTFGVSLENVEFIYAPTNAIWMRDYGPWFVDDQGEQAVVDLRYYPTRPQDDNIPNVLHDYWDTGYYGPNLYNEGGNMMNDGYGTMMMTTRVMDANPGMTQQEVAEIYGDYLGQDNVYIFNRIPQAYDGTGHIDLWSKIISPTSIMVAEMQQGDPNYNLIEGHAATMDAIPTHDGGTFDIHRVPMPPHTGYYRSYVNCIMVNNKAIIPIYNIPMDDEAIAAWQTALGPDWEVVGVDCNEISPLGGQIHCVTIEVPNELFAPFVITLNTDYTPWIIPWGGGSFEFSAVLENNTGNVVTGQAWTEVLTPSDNLISPLLMQTITLQPNSVLETGTFSQYMPAGAPGGFYTYTAKVGLHPNIVVAEDSFEIQKLGNDPDGDTQNWDIVEKGVSGETAATSAERPTAYELSEAYPNPFNPTTTVSVALPATAELSVQVFDLQGRRVMTLADGVHQAGRHELVVDGNGLASGVYFVRATVPGELNQVRKITLMK